MRKIIFGVFSAAEAKAFIRQQDAGIVLKDSAIYDALKSLFSNTFSTAKKSFKYLFEQVGLPSSRAELYQDLKKDTQTLVAIIVPLEMEERVRSTYKKFRAQDTWTINCP